MILVPRGAVVFAIGVSVGKDTYKDTDVPITPHFSWEQAQRYRHVIEIQSHTYDMHQITALDGQDCRSGVLQKLGEDPADYKQAFQSDILLSRQDIEDSLNTTITAFAYPFGTHNELTEKWLTEMGVRITMSTEEKVCTVTRGDDSSLLLLGRLTITEGVDVIRLIESHQQTVSSLPLPRLTISYHSCDVPIT